MVEENPLVEQARKLFSGRVEFLLSAPSLDFLPEADYPEVAFAGRSNVGKSSLINAVTGRRSIARTSVTPGRTQELNFFEVGEPTLLRLVDMPGYGFAKAPPKVVEKWKRLVRDFLRGRLRSGRGLRSWPVHACRAEEGTGESFAQRSQRLAAENAEGPAAKPRATIL